MEPRVWDRFLTEQDRAHYERQIPKARGFGKSPALLLVDLYRNVFGDRPQPLMEAIESWPSSCGLAGWTALPHIERVLSSARRAAIPVIHVTALPELQTWREPRGSGGSSHQAPKAVPAGDTSGYDIVPQLAPQDGEHVLRKASPSAFWGTPLVGLLQQLAVDTVIVCGETTSGCVRATVVDACSYRYKVVVVEEGVFDRTEASHAMSLFDLSQKYADVLPASDVEKFLVDLP